MQQVRKIAMSLPEAEEGTSCNKSAFQARKKSFCFLGEKDDSYNVMVKLVDSLPEAEQLQTDSPEHFKVGLHGWTTVVFPQSENPPVGLFEKWIVESYRTLAHKQLVAQVSDSTTGSQKASVKKRVSKKATAKKRAAKKPAKKSVAKKKELICSFREGAFESHQARARVQDVSLVGNRYSGEFRLRLIE